MPRLHALLVGIDGFEPERFPDGEPVPHLSGAVNDVLRMKELLIQGPPEVPEDCVRTLISPNPFSGRPRPAAADLPTLANLRCEIPALGDRAEAGDQVLIHFSGHGARLPSASPGPKAEPGWDECLVPCDAARSGYLRDWEVHRFLHELAARGLHVIVVLDCCHSGGVFRGRSVRGITPSWPGPPPPERPEESLVLGDGFPRANGSTRSATPSAGWWPAPEGSVLLAACRPTELARESVFVGIGPSGALTHHLLETTGSLGSRATYRDLHRSLLARIHGEFPTQTPVIEGAADLRFLGLERWPGLHGVTVMATRWRDDTCWVRLATGLAQGVRAGARFSLHPPGAGSDGDGLGEPADGPAGDVEIVDAGGGASWARAHLETPVDDLSGWTAVLVDPGPLALVRRIAVHAVPEAPGTEEEAESARTILERVRSAIAADRQPWLEPAGDDGADLGVAWSPEQGLVVVDPSGEPLPVQGSRVESEEEVLDRLCHLARFSSVRALHNPDRSSRLRGALRIELDRLEAEWPGGPARAEPLPADGGVPCGEEVELRIRNDSDFELQVAVLDLQPDWGISQVHPASGGAVTLAPGDSTIARLEVDLPFEGSEGRDLLKVVATREPVDFSWLVLPALDGSGATRRWRSGGEPRGPLESLFARLTADRPATRTVRTVVPAGGDWTVADVELRVIRAEAEPEPAVAG